MTALKMLGYCMIALAFTIPTILHHETPETP